MSNLYNVVERVINATTLEEAENIFYGKDKMFCYYYDSRRILCKWYMN